MRSAGALPDGSCSPVTLARRWKLEGVTEFCRAWNATPRPLLRGCVCGAGVQDLLGREGQPPDASENHRRCASRAGCHLLHHGVRHSLYGESQPDSLLLRHKIPDGGNYSGWCSLHSHGAEPDVLRTGTGCIGKQHSPCIGAGHELCSPVSGGHQSPRSAAKAASAGGGRTVPAPCLEQVASRRYRCSSWVPCRKRF